MENIRTDLAVEWKKSDATPGEDDGIQTTESRVGGFKICTTEVFEGRGETRTGRQAGKYLTVETGKLWLESRSRREDAAKVLREQILALLPKNAEGATLVVGLGNEEITPDSVGPAVVKKLVVSHHIQRLNPSLYEALKLGDLAALTPGVLGQTGVESAALVRAAADTVKPGVIIAVDALAAGTLGRLATTVQITNGGIAPGSGVCNGREELSEKTLGCPVIAIGVPTVVDAPALLRDLGGEDVKCESFFVTPKENDVMIRVISDVIAAAINSAIHKDAEDVEEYVPL